MTWRKAGDGAFEEGRGVDTPIHNILDILLHKTHMKVLRLHMCTSMISLSKIAHQMWHGHPLSQRNKTTKWAMGVGLGSNRGRGGLRRGKEI